MIRDNAGTLDSGALSGIEIVKTGKDVESELIVRGCSIIVLFVLYCYFFVFVLCYFLFFFLLFFCFFFVIFLYCVVCFTQPILLHCKVTAAVRLG